MNISAINRVGFGSEMARSEMTDDSNRAGSSFMNELNNSMKNVNQLLAEADKSTQDLAVGRSENLHEAMINTEKAETALKYLVQVKNKCMEAYHEVMRMQL